MDNMLSTCFLHLPGVGPAFERKLHGSGIFTWGDALTQPLPCGPAKAEALRNLVRESQERLEAGDAFWFGERLAPSEQWRLFPHFRHSAAYVDIETNGLAYEDMEITSIALYDGEHVRTYVQGQNLEAFSDDILGYKLLVTWNGRCFDAPILRRALQIPLDKGGDMAHLDLRPVFRALGLRGGLKLVEKRLGLSRDELDGVDGWTAVWLWREYCNTDNPAALETLLAYNVADVLSLEYLAWYALNAHTPGCDQAGHEALPLPEVRYDLNPHVPDRDLLRRILWRC